jgi:hypothetical protein
MSVSRIEDALSQLDSTEQALLDLSLHRGFDDQLLASLVEGDAADVGAMRDAVLDKLARIAELNGEGAREQVLSELRSLSDATWIDPDAPPPPRRRRAPIAVAAVALLAGLAVAIALLAGGGSSSPDKPVAENPSDAGGSSAPAKPARSAAVPLEPLGPATKGQVTASVSGPKNAQRLTLKLSGLKAPRGGAYELWLYDSLLRSRALGSLAAGNGTIAAPLRTDAATYRWLDLSLQPGKDRVHHSGDSVFRAPISRVAGGG